MGEARSIHELLDMIRESDRQEKAAQEALASARAQRHQVQQFLRVHRESRGISQNQLSGAAEVTQAYLSQIENSGSSAEGTTASSGTLERIINAIETVAEGGSDGDISEAEGEGKAWRRVDGKADAREARG